MQMNVFFYILGQQSHMTIIFDHSQGELCFPWILKAVATGCSVPFCNFFIYSDWGNVHVAGEDWDNNQEDAIRSPCDVLVPKQTKVVSARFFFIYFHNAKY